MVLLIGVVWMLLFPLIQLPRKSEALAIAFAQKIVNEFPLIQLPRKSEDIVLTAVGTVSTASFH